MNGTGFIHDINAGNGPAVSSVDNGNGFGTRVFWTAVIPDSDVQVNPGAGTAQMHVHNLPELDYSSPDGNAALLSLGPTWQTGYFDSTVSFDVVWNGPVTRRVNVKDAVNGFAGIFNENQATVTWSVQSASGFSFTSNPGNFSTSVPEIPGVSGVTAPLNFFAQVGFERNGIFFPPGVESSASSAGSFILPPTLTALASTVTGATSPAAPVAAAGLTSNPWLTVWSAVPMGGVHDTRSDPAAGAYQVRHKVWNNSANNLLGDGLVNDLVAQSIVGSLTGSLR